MKQDRGGASAAVVPQEGDTSHAVRRRRIPLARRRDFDRFVFPAPAVLLTLVMLGFPIVYTLYLSFNEWSGGTVAPKSVGGENYGALLQDDRFWGGIWRMAYFVGISVTAQTVLGVLAALVFSKTFAGRGLARTIFMFPMIATPTAMAMVWKMLYDPTIGGMRYITSIVGLPRLEWTTSPDLVIPSLALVDTWQWTPLVMLITAAGLAALPKEPFEAARIDGANAMQTFFSVTLPMLWPVLLVAVVFRSIDCMKTFDIIMIITAGGPAYGSETLNVYAFHQGLSYLHFGYGSAILVVLAVLVFGVALFLNRLQNRAGR